MANARAARVAAWLDDLQRDLRFAARALRRRPGFALLAALTLAIGLGGATAMFSVVNAVLIRTLPFPHPERLVMIQGQEMQHGRRFRFDNLNAAVLAPLQASGAFDNVGMAGYSNPDVTMDGRALEARVRLASPKLFATLGIKPERGRWPQAGEVVVSDGFWRRQMAGAEVLGKTVRFDAHQDAHLATIVGIVPAGQSWPFTADMWEGWPAAQGAAAGEGAGDGTIVARLRGGLTLAAAQAAAQTAETALPTHTGSLVVSPLRRQRVQPATRQTQLVLAAAMGCLLLIAGINMAHLLLSRGLERAAEWRVRRALGASNGRLLRQRAAEAVLLAGAGVAGGTALAAAILQWVRALPSGIPRIHAARLDAPALWFCAAVALICALLCALAGSGRRESMFRAMLVGEVALSLVLLIGGGLLARSLDRLWRVDPGFDARALTTAEVHMASLGAVHNQEDRWRLQSQRLETARLRLASLPGIAAASYTDSTPFEGVNGIEVSLPGQEAGVVADWLEAGPNYFATMGIRLWQGRDFTAADMQPRARAVIVNRRLADVLFPGRDPLGQVLVDGQQRRLTIVGIAPDVHNVALGDGARPQAFYPLVGNKASATFLWRGPTVTAASALRVLSSGQDVSVSEPVALERVLADSLAEPRLRAVLLSAFAVAALTLATVGLYGIMAYEVRRRRPEHAVRLALGSSVTALTALVLRRGLALTALGLALGGLASWWARGALAGLLFGVRPGDATTWLFAIGALLLAAVAACLVPALRAARTDPAALLRAE